MAITYTLNDHDGLTINYHGQTDQKTLHILYEIDHMHKPSIHKVAEALGTDITTFSRQIQKLIKMNLVKNTPDPDDRRFYVLSLTTEGTYVATTIDQQMNDYLNEVFSHMNEFEKDTVIRSIKLLNDSMLKSCICCTTTFD